MKREKGNIDDIVRQHLPSASQEHMEQDIEHLFERMPALTVVEHSTKSVPARPRRWQWPAVAAIAAAVLLAVFLPTQVVQSAPAVLEDANGSRKIQYGEVIRPSGDKNAMLSMSDGSRVEMRAQSEFLLERAEDGATRIRLNRGAVTVVAALAGEVRVQQGTTEVKLRTGEQATADPVPSKERIAFDVVAIRPSGAFTPTPGARGGDGSNAGVIKGCVPGSSGYSHQLDPSRLAVTRVTAFQLMTYAYPIPVPDSIWKQYPGADFCLLVGKTGRLVGGPEWIKSDLWNIEAAIPAGAFTARPNLLDPKLQQMLQAMLAERFKLVVRRETRDMPVYLLKVGKNGPKFNGSRQAAPPTPLQPDQKPRVMVSIGPDGSRTRTVQSPDGTFAGAPAAAAGLSVVSSPTTQDGTFMEGPPSREGISRLDAIKITMASWANHLSEKLDGRPVLDRTGLAGTYDFYFDFRGPTIADVAANPSQFGGLGESVNREAVKAMGFELEESRVPFEVWVIERAERPSLEFEVATIKPEGAARVDPRVTPSGCRGTDTRPDRRSERPQVPLGRCSFPQSTLASLLRMAYGDIEDVTGGPDWVRSESFHIEAKAPNPSQATGRDLYVMLRKLIEDRFKLKVRRQSKEISGYGLVPAKSGPRLAEAKNTEVRPNVNGRPLPGAMTLTGLNASMDNLAKSLSRFGIGTVSDKTELGGNFDFELTFAMDPGMQSPKSPGPVQSVPGAAPSLFTAIEQQLGLRLVPQKLNLEYLVIEAVEKPTEN